MARVEYASSEDVDHDLADIFEGQRRLGGRVTNFHRIMGRIPHVYKWHIPFSAAARSSKTGVPKRIRLLAEIRTSIVNECEYCATHTSTMGRNVGITDQEIAALRSGDGLSELLTPAEVSVVDWATAVSLNTARRDQRAFKRLREFFDEAQVIELTVLISARTMINRIQEALWTDLEEPDQVAAPHTTTPDSDLDAYTRDVLCREEHR